ncbi:hypothetical protein TNCV_839751 [Trichonephila clavipes]|nr:hypothetical protein TNCV_839751 [Trichonephila clavipes]
MITLIIYSRETSGSSRKNNVAVGCLVLLKENDLPPANGQWQESWRLFMELTDAYRKILGNSYYLGSNCDEALLLVNWYPPLA